MDLLSSKQTELEAVKANLEAMEIIMQKQLKVLNVQLAEAQEEIAVKVAQVKQYQKQVEAYKGQVCTHSNITDMHGFCKVWMLFVLDGNGCEHVHSIQMHCVKSKVMHMYTVLLERIYTHVYKQVVRLQKLS